MKYLLTILAVISVAFVSSCDVQSGISRKSVEEFQPTPLPSVQPTVEEAPIDPADIVQVDTSQQGEILSVNKSGEKKTLDCKKYDQVMINSSEAVVTVKGACRVIMVNGNNNQVTAEASMAITFNGENNKVTYTKFANGKRPSITNNKPGNTTEKTTAQTTKDSQTKPTTGK